MWCVCKNYLWYASGYCFDDVTVCRLGIASLGNPPPSLTPLTLLSCVAKVSLPLHAHVDVVSHNLLLPYIAWPISLFSFRDLGPPRNVFLRPPLLLIKNYRVSAWVVVSNDGLVWLLVMIQLQSGIARKKTQKRSLWSDGDEFSNPACCCWWCCYGLGWVFRTGTYIHLGILNMQLSSSFTSPSCLSVCLCVCPRGQFLVTPLSLLLLAFP